MPLKRNVAGQLVRNSLGQLVRCGDSPAHCIPMTSIYSAVQVSYSGVVRCDNGQPLPNRSATFFGLAGTTACCYAPAGVELDYVEPVTGQPMLLSMMMHYSWNAGLMRETHYFVVQLGRSSPVFGQPGNSYFFAVWPCPRDDMCFPTTLPIDNANLPGDCGGIKTYGGLGPGTCGFSGQVRIRGHGGTAQLSFIV